MFLYHYYDKDYGPFRNLSDLTDEEAASVINRIAYEKKDSFCNQRNAEYLEKRKYYENILREEFLKKGGKVQRHAPQYMVIGECDFLSSWYVNSAYIKIDIEEFDKSTLSFTYGDSHPTFSDLVNDGKEYRKKLYTYDEILKVIDRYGYPQEWNKDGVYGPERYVEVHVWSDETLGKYYKVSPGDGVSGSG